MISSPLSATRLLFLFLPAEKSFPLGEAKQESPNPGKQAPILGPGLLLQMGLAFCFKDAFLTWTPSTLWLKSCLTLTDPQPPTFPNPGFM